MPGNTADHAATFQISTSDASGETYTVHTNDEQYQDFLRLTLEYYQQAITNQFLGASGSDAWGYRTAATPIQMRAEATRRRGGASREEVDQALATGHQVRTTE